MLPLEGLTVIAVEQAVAAPFCSSRLADAGAHVIKIERPEGDFARGYDNLVHGESAYFVWLNRGKESVVLGLVTSKTGTLEKKDAIKRRIDEAAKYVSLDQLCLSPQCGFASTEEGNVLAEEEQWAKLRMIVELADEVWGR